MPFKRLFIIFISFFYCSVSSGQTRTDSLLNKIKTSGVDSNVIKLLINKGVEYQDSYPDSSIFYINIALEAAKKGNYYKQIAICERLIGVAYSNKGIYFKATESLIRSLNMYEKLYDLNGIAAIYVSLATINRHQREYEKAIEYFFKAIKIYKKLYGKANPEYIAICYLIVGTNYDDQKAYDKALDYYNKALLIYKAIGNKKGVAFCYNTIGIVHSNYEPPPSEIKTVIPEHYKIAHNYFLKALELFEDANNNIGIASVYMNLADLNIRLKNYNKAVFYANKGKEIVEGTGSLPLLKIAYENLSISYDCLNDYKNAFYYHKLLKQINDSIFSLEKSKQINELQLKYETKKKEKEIADKNAKITLLEQIKKTDNLKKNILTVGILSIILISFILVAGLRRRIKLNKQLYENKKLLSETELENEKLKSIQLQKELELKKYEIEYKNRELEYKSHELVDFALHIAKKNEFLENLKNALASQGEKVKTSKINKIIALNQMNLDEERKELEARIELVNEAFYLKLRSKAPDITQAEERLCGLLKLKLSSKEIALALNISSQSVDVYRYRLRKKFNLDKDENLNDFMNSL